MRYKNIIEWLKRIRANPPQNMPIRESGAFCAIEAFGEDLVSELPVLANFGALKILGGNDISLLSMRSAASTLIHETDLHSLPSEPPKLFKNPFVLQAANVKRPLWGNTVGLGVYEIDGSFFIIGQSYPDGVRFTKWEPEWVGGEITDSVRADNSPLIAGSSREHDEWALQAAQYLVTLSILLEAENSPLELKRIKRSKDNERGIYYEPEQGTTIFEESDSDKISASVMVTGHLKRQRFGEGLKNTRWIWVSDYSARRWVVNFKHTVDKSKLS